MNASAISENLELAQQSLEHWLSFQKYIKRSFDESAVTPEDASNFLEIKSSIKKNSRSLSEKIKEVGRMDYGEKGISELLTKCVSVEHMKSLPPNDKRGIEKEWHQVFIKLSRSVGALKMLSEGYVPVDPAKSKKKKKGGSNKTIIIVVAVIVALVIGFFALQFMGIIG